MRRHREYLKGTARDQAFEYANYLELLVSLHHDCDEVWDCSSEPTAPPEPPVRLTRNEVSAQTYQRGFLGFTCGVKQQWAAREAAVRNAIAADDRQYQLDMSEYNRQSEHRAYVQHLAEAVAARQLDGCRAALDYTGAFDELALFNTRVRLQSVAGGIATIDCVIEDHAAVPDEVAASRYSSLYRAHVASSAIRIAREVFATLSAVQVVTNIRAHRRPFSILDATFTRDAFVGVDMESIDPSAWITCFVHRHATRAVQDHWRVAEK
ncbi:MAG: hypothetical protein ABI867_22000 [Kofleriaceae bacterium]